MRIAAKHHCIQAHIHHTNLHSKTCSTKAFDTKRLRTAQSPTPETAAAMASSAGQPSHSEARHRLAKKAEAVSATTTKPSSRERGWDGLSSTSSSSQPLRKEITRTQLAKRIAKGETLVLRGRTVYKLDNWLKSHPGGELAILHFVGRDASDEMEVYHSPETLDRMKVFAVATLAEEDWLGDVRKSDGRRTGYKPLLPPVQLGYRNGKLDHPEAHEDLWARQRKARTRSKMPAVDGEGTLEGLREASPLTDTDSGYESGGLSLPVSEDEQPIRPQTFPLPVSLLEPPSDPVDLDVAKERDISTAFKQLHQEVKAAGLYTLHPMGYVRECARYLTLGTVAFLFWHHAQGRTSFFLASSFFLGLFWHQLTFSAHDSGHDGITHVHAIDRTIGIVIADFIGGLSLGWWCDNHDVHHLVTNHPEHDPDIQHMPFFAISPRFVGSNADADDKSSLSRSLGLWSSYYRRVLAFDAPARTFLKLQHQLYYVVMSLGRFNLYANSYGFLALKAKRDRWFLLESVGLVVFWAWYGALLASCPSWGVRVGYLLISHIVTSPLHVQVSFELLYY